MLIPENKIDHENPSSLFKYYSISDQLIENLTNSQFWFSSPEFFNDPFDSISNGIFYISRQRSSPFENGNELIKLKPHINDRYPINADKEEAIANFIIKKFGRSVSDNWGQSNIKCAIMAQY